MSCNQKIAIGIGAGIMIVGVVWYKTNLAQALSDNARPPVSLVQAVETVLAANPGTIAIDAELQREQTGLAWKVQLNNDLYIFIDANTNQIVKTEQPWKLEDTPLLGSLIPKVRSH